MSFDTVEKNKKFVDKFGFNYTLLCDVDRKLGLAYGATDDAKAKSPRRVSFLIAPDGKIKFVWDRVDTKTHWQAVLDQIR